MRKITTFKLLLALALGTASVFGLFHATAQPAEALTCAPKRFTCNFQEVRDVGGAICCVYACANGNEIVGHDCAQHSSDYSPADWVIELGEMLRLVQFYNLGGYIACDGSEDGFCVLTQ